jgi:chromosome partitioning protein
MQVVSLVNMKGGVAKTTLAVNIADHLDRRYARKVLMIDIDPQFNATQCLLSPEHYVEKLKEGKHTVIDIFDDSPRPTASSIELPQIREPVKITSVEPWGLSENLYLLPGALELYRLEMGGGQGRENRLRRYIDHLRKNNAFDFVIIDTPPTPSVWMASALIASDHYLVPVKPEPLSTTGIDLLRAVVSKVSENYALNIKCLGVVLTIAEENTIVFRQTKKFIEDNPFWHGKLFTYSLPKRTEVARIQGSQGKILDIDDGQLKISMARITQELLERIGEI